MGSRRQARECALQMLFQLDVTGDATGEVIHSYLTGKNIPDDVSEFASELVRTVGTHREHIDRLIEEAGASWRLERMAVVDRNILRLAIAELSSEGTPSAVVINEAIEIAKRYSAPEAPTFVNGILDAVRKRMESGGGVLPGPAAKDA